MTESTKLALVVNKLSKVYSHVEEGVLEDISFSVRRGEVLCIIGPSGCGKSTLLRILSGSALATSGTFAVNSAGGIEPSISYMQQGDSLLPWRSVSQNVHFGLEVLGIDRRDAKQIVDQMLCEVGLWQARNRFPAEISGGMRRRVALARALAVQCDLLLLDEPLVHLDFFSKNRLASFVRSQITSTAVATVLVTHSIDEAVAIADRVLVLRGRPARISDEFPILREDLVVNEFGGLPAKMEYELYARVASAFEEYIR